MPKAKGLISNTFKKIVFLVTAKFFASITKRIKEGGFNNLSDYLRYCIHFEMSFNAGHILTRKDWERVKKNLESQSREVNTK